MNQKWFTVLFVLILSSFIVIGFSYSGLNGQWYRDARGNWIPGDLPKSSAPLQVVAPPKVATCSDSDGGKNYGVKGFVEGYSTNAYANYKTEDSCQGTGTLLEQYCTLNNMPNIDVKYCDKGQTCKNGVCIISSSVPAPVVVKPSLTTISCIPKCISVCGGEDNGCGSKCSAKNTFNKFGTKIGSFCNAPDGTQGACVNGNCMFCKKSGVEASGIDGNGKPFVFKDECSTSSQLRYFQCWTGSNLIGNTPYTSGYKICKTTGGCQNGVCVGQSALFEPACSDSDAGRRDIITKGSVSGNDATGLKYVAEDTCLDGRTLQEQTCDGNKLSFKTVQCDCKFCCRDSACVMPPSMTFIDPFADMSKQAQERAQQDAQMQAEFEALNERNRLSVQRSLDEIRQKEQAAKAELERNLQASYEESLKRLKGLQRDTQREIDLEREKTNIEQRNRDLQIDKAILTGSIDSLPVCSE